MQKMVAGYRRPFLRWYGCERLQPALLAVVERGGVVPPTKPCSHEPRIQKNQLCDICVVRLQLHWIRLVASGMAATVSQVQRRLQVLVLCVIQICEES